MEKEINDRELILALKKGSKTALNTLLIRYGRWIFTDALYRTRSKKYAYEIVTEVFAELWENKEAKNLNNIDIKAYLFRSMIDLLKRKYKPNIANGSNNINNSVITN